MLILRSRVVKALIIGVLLTLLYEAGQYLLTAKTDDVSGYFHSFALITALWYFVRPLAKNTAAPISEPKQD